ncbi:MAG: amidohydrolase, partial [Proteobacteria bacterium]|nr:amidohydrolase [Pseudomonadota bacterium]
MQFPGACDTHMHIYDAARPAAPGAHNPGEASIPMYRAIQERVGLERVIVVQPNAYAADNAVTLAAVRALGPGARAVG